MTVATTQARLRLRGCFQGVSGELDRFGEFRRYYDEIRLPRVGVLDQGDARLSKLDVASD